MSWARPVPCQPKDTARKEESPISAHHVACHQVEEMDNSGHWLPNQDLLWQCGQIFLAEVTIDVAKHAVVGKFNEIRPGVYREFMKVCHATHLSFLQHDHGFKHLTTYCAGASIKFSCVLCQLCCACQNQALARLLCLWESSPTGTAFPLHWSATCVLRQVSGLRLLNPYTCASLTYNSNAKPAILVSVHLMLNGNSEPSMHPVCDGANCNTFDIRYDET